MYIMPGYDRLDHDAYISSNAEEHATQWSATTTYLQGDLCKDGETVYECAVGPAKFLAGQYCGAKHGVDLPNINNNPALYPTVPAMDRTAYPKYTDIDDCYEESGKLWWIRRGDYWENQYRMFDEQPDLITEGPPSTTTSTLTVNLRHTSAFGAIAFIRTQATTIRFQGTIIPDNTSSDPGGSESSSELGSDVREIDVCVDTDLALPAADIYKNSFLRLGGTCPANSEFQLTFIHDNTRRRGTVTFARSASVGLVLCGYLINIGQTLYNSAVGIQDFSKKERDAFGRSIIIPRTYTNKITFKIACDTERIYMIKEFLASCRAILCLYSALDTDFNMAVAGYFKDFSIPIDSYTESIFNLDVEGL